MRPADLELTPDEARRALELATERVVALLRALPHAPAARLDGVADAVRVLREDPPRDGSELEEALAVLCDRALAVGLDTSSPGFLGYITGGGLVLSAVADVVADVANRYAGSRHAAPGIAALEDGVLRWLCRDVVGYEGDGAGGILTSGGSMANLSAVVAAREGRLRGEDARAGTAYASDQAHHSVAKACAIAGVPVANVRSLPTDATFRVDVDAVRRAVRADRAAGRRPFLLVASAGTTNTGAVDDLEALADLAAEEDLWLHADAAYGGFFALTTRGRRVLRGLARADTVTLDPHKSLFLPFGTGSLVAKDVQALRRTFAVDAGSYMQDVPRDELQPFDLGPELTRSARGLRAWLPLRVHGVAAFEAALDRCLDLAQWTADELRATPGVEVVAEPQLSILAFRAGSDERTRRVMDDVNARGRVHLSGATLRGRFAARVCVLSHRTRMEHVAACVEDVRAALSRA